jgi:hypothetical protein
MGLFGGKLGEIFCRQCESRKTKAGLIGHEGMFILLSIAHERKQKQFHSEHVSLFLFTPFLTSSFPLFLFVN